MNIENVFSLLDGIFVDFDGYYGDQCVDLVQVVNRFYGAPALTGNAKDIWNIYPYVNYTKIVNSPDNFPVEGDIVIWGSGIGPNGHIAVARKGSTGMVLNTFDQNFPIGSRCHSVVHTYNGVLGWLHKK